MMKSAFVTVCGRPSAGKSTLVNTKCGHKLAIVSRTPQTTKNKIRGIYTVPEGQFVFLDTPGYYNSDKKSNIELQEITLSALDDSDLILYVTDMTREPGKEEEILAGIVTKTQRPLFVALNKCDTLTEELGDEASKTIAERRDFFLKALNVPESHIFTMLRPGHFVATEEMMLGRSRL